MVDRGTRKRIKKIQKGINRLKGKVKKIELRPCHSDEELKQRDEEVQAFKREISELERDINVISLTFRD
jgi:peptidoglycan hydrolase CwlO-like protein